MAMQGSVNEDYSGVTETPGIRVTREAVSMIYTRYHFAADLCRGKDVLEVACGSGAGLGYLARFARMIIGGDFTEALLKRAQSHYQGRIPLVRLDAHALPFPASSLDVVILFEAIYYLDRPEEFLLECRRVLKVGGVLLLCTANLESENFIPSPFCTRYFSAAHLEQILCEYLFEVRLFCAFPSVDDRDLTARIRKLAGRLHLIPKTMRGKEYLKRLFYGPLVELGQELQDGMTALEPLTPVSHGAASINSKVIYAIAQKTFDSVSSGEDLRAESSSFA